MWLLANRARGSTNHSPRPRGCCRRFHSPRSNCASSPILFAVVHRRKFARGLLRCSSQDARREAELDAMQPKNATPDRAAVQREELLQRDHRSKRAVWAYARQCRTRECVDTVPHAPPRRRHSGRLLFHHCDTRDGPQQSRLALLRSRARECQLSQFPTASPR